MEGIGTESMPLPRHRAMSGGRDGRKRERPARAETPGTYPNYTAGQIDLFRTCGVATSFTGRELRPAAAVIGGSAQASAEREARKQSRQEQRQGAYSKSLVAGMKRGTTAGPVDGESGRHLPTESGKPRALRLDAIRGGVIAPYSGDSRERPATNSTRAAPG